EGHATWPVLRHVRAGSCRSPRFSAILIEFSNRSPQRSGALRELRSDDKSAIPPALEVGRWSGCRGIHASLGCQSPAVRRRRRLPPAYRLRLLLQLDRAVEPALSARWS